MKTRKPRNRTAVLREQVLTEMRQRIVNGDYRCGERLPTRSEFVKQEKISIETCQRVFEQLEQEGFVESFGARGTFVSETPPHLSQIGVVFPFKKPDQGGYFYEAIFNEVNRFSDDKVRPVFFHGDWQDPEHDIWLGLAEAVRTHQLAGIIWTAPLLAFHHDTVRCSGLPQVAVMRIDPVEPTICKSAGVDFKSFYSKSLQHLANLNCRRIAMITESEEYHDFAMENIQRLGMRCEPFWYHRIPPTSPSSTRNLTHLLLQSRDNQGNPPDGLLVGNDNFAKYIMAGIHDAKIAVGKDIQVACHWNFSSPPPELIPFQWIGFDIQKLTKTCLDIIFSSKPFASHRNLTLIPACSLEEWRQNTKS